MKTFGKAGMTGLILLITLSLHAQRSGRAMASLIDEDMKLAAEQYKLLGTHLPSEEMPRTYDEANNKWVTSNTKWWCSGFYPGALWMIYAATGDEAIRKEAESRLNILEKEKYYTGNHDLGFMMFCSFGTAYQITGNEAYKDIILTSANTLTKRYRPSIRAIQSWDSSKNFKCPVIIDNMMNLELLEWAAGHGGDQRLDEIAVNHANTTLRNHFRDDYSSYHVVDYDLATGKPAAKKTHQGDSDESAWARGQAWGLYGYTMMYRYTKKPEYLAQARHIAQFLLNHPNMPEDKIPYWDFNAPDIPTAKRDASAAAIMASAYLELGQYSSGKERKRYVNTAGTILRNLSSANYLAKPGTNGGFLLLHSVGHLPAHSEVDVPLTYADYYFIEALSRYKKWYL
ncbi:MAG TPA: glycoside hydrolase family 88 protein [Chitinophagaceae bacterium]|nr:glycoside hydrolase family 88 protein [Chitinophagaceae bacterium]